MMVKSGKGISGSLELLSSPLLFGDFCLLIKKYIYFPLRLFLPATCEQNQFLPFVSIAKAEWDFALIDSKRKAFSS